MKGSFDRTDQATSNNQTFDLTLIDPCGDTTVNTLGSSSPVRDYKAEATNYNDTNEIFYNGDTVSNRVGTPYFCG